MSIELNKDRENLKSNIDYNEEDRNNSQNSHIDEFGFNSYNIIKIKTLKREIEIKDQDTNYELVFNDQGVFWERISKRPNCVRVWDAS